MNGLVSYAYSDDEGAKNALDQSDDNTNTLSGLVGYAAGSDDEESVREKKVNKETPDDSIVDSTEKQPDDVQMSNNKEKDEVDSSDEDDFDYSTWCEPVEGEPAEDLVAIVKKWDALTKTGSNINRELRKNKKFNNPNILKEFIVLCNIKEIGTCYDKDVFDISAQEHDFYDKIEAHSDKLKAEKRGNRKRKRQIEFEKGSTDAIDGENGKGGLEDKSKDKGNDNDDEQSRAKRKKQGSKWDC